ncbi:MAG: hypothetical protein J5767_12390 [Paludibacteraceae bacterium]|nr:hypothetical protein [Paludibacteraceae bacterium]
MIYAIQIDELLTYVAIFAFAYILFIYVNMFIVSHGFKIDLHKMLNEKTKKDKNEDYIDFIALIMSMSFISTPVLIIMILYDKLNK